MHDEILPLNHTPQFATLLRKYGPCLDVDEAQVDLRDVYDVACHIRTGAIIVATKPVEIPCITPRSQIPYVTRQIACTISHPLIGVEAINIGLVGNVQEGEVVVRLESSCPPSFLFGSQKCNCADQWASAREIAGKMANERGFILIHLDSQAGMGAGFTKGEYAGDLYSRAMMRQVGENVLGLSIKLGYEALGVCQDGRREEGGFGYQVPAIALQFIGASSSLALLSNNRQKISQLENCGFSVRRVKLLGKIDKEGLKVARERRDDYAHLDIGEEIVGIDDEINRLEDEFSLQENSVLK